jgi:dienelactone hydrolase
MKRVIALIAVLAIVLAACGSSVEDPKYEVMKKQVAAIGDGDTQDVFVWAPDAEGSFPFVYAIPGSGGYAERDMDVLASELAGQGVVVFGADWRTAQPGVANMEKDVECGYRLTRELAEQYGADLSQPVTWAGFSLGADAALYLGLNESEFGTDGWYQECSPGVPRPDVIVGIEGCHIENEFPSGVRSWGNSDVDILLIAAGGDSPCGPANSAHAEGILEAKGYTVRVAEISGASHGEVVFHDDTGEEGDDWTTLERDNPAGQETVRLILEAIETARE